MNIKIKYTNLESTDAIATYAENKFESILKILSRLDAEGTADLHLELALTTHHHQKGQIYMAKANLHIPAKTFQISEEAEDLYAAIDLAKDKLQRAVEKYKDFKKDEEGK